MIRSTDWYVERRIASPDGSYPASEARFDNCEEYIDYLEQSRGWGPKYDSDL